MRALSVLSSNSNMFQQKKNIAKTALGLLDVVVLYIVSIVRVFMYVQCIYAGQVNVVCEHP